jgi:hypothetical protein
VRHARPATLVFVLAAALLSARPAGADEHRFRVRVGGGAALGTIGWSTVSTWEVHQETAELEADYEAGLGPAFEAGLDVRVSRAFGLRAAVSWSRRDADASLQARIPHPFFFDRPRGLEAGVSSLEYRQLASHFDLEWRPVTGRLEVALFGGVYLVRVEADLVERVEYDEDYPFDEVSFRTAVLERVRSDAGLGWSAGASVSHTLGSRVAFGVQARYTTARLDLVRVEGDAVPLDVGGVQLLATLSVGF